MKNVIVGIDIGTTTISIVVVNNNTITKSFTISNDAWIRSSNSFDREQDPQTIINKVMNVIEEIQKEHIILSIGLTGQMHGILFVDKAGEPVSPLYTWQDEKSKQIIQDKNISYCDEIKQLTGENIYPGYGFATCYYLLKNNMIHDKANKICTIMDYLGMKLCNIAEPVVHSSTAASIGFFDNATLRFKSDQLDKIGLKKYVPAVVSKNVILGYYNNIPVFVAVGDNQASVYASIGMDDTKILVNFGTGSQISAIIKDYVEISDCEVRPYFGSKYLLVGSALCGGKAYAVLEKFFRSYSKKLGHDESQYEILNELAIEGFHNQSEIKADTRFCGTRSNPNATGGYKNLTDENFTASNIVYSTICGMVEELYEMFTNMHVDNITSVIASGNAVKKNPILQKVIGQYFCSQVQLLPFNEEAAYGAAILCKSNNN